MPQSTPFPLRLMRTLVLSLLVFSSAHAASPPADASFDFSRYEGRVVILDFWASWCGPCRRSFPWFNAMQKKYADAGLVVVGVNSDKEWSAAERFLEDTPGDFQMVFDPRGELKARFGVTGMPTTFVFDRTGQMVAKHLGFDPERTGEYEEILKETLARQPEPALR